MATQKNAFVLSGGAFLGAFQVGVIDALSEAGITPDYICGISTGALNGAVLATGRLDLLRDLWLEQLAHQGPGMIYTSEWLDTTSYAPRFDLRRIVDRLIPSQLKAIWQLLSSRGRKRLGDEVAARYAATRALSDNAPLSRLLETLLAEHPLITPFGCGAASLDTGGYYCQYSSDFATTSEHAAFVAASASMPILWPSRPVTLKNGTVLTNLVDGGVLNISPLGDALDYILGQPDADSWRVWVINCSTDQTPFATTSSWTLGNTALRCYNMVMDEVLRGDVRALLTINDLVGQATTPLYHTSGRTYRHVEARLIAPTTYLGDSLDASPARLRDRFEAGRQATRRLLGH